MITFVVQVVFVVGLSVCAALAFGMKLYGVMSTLTTIIALAFFAARERDVRHALETATLSVQDKHGDEPFAISVFYRFLVAAFLGMIWPSLPFIVWHERGADSRGTSD